MSATTEDEFAQLAYRVVRQALIDALPDYWDRRAVEFAAVGTPRSDAIALACRRHAWLLRTDRHLTATADATLEDFFAGGGLSTNEPTFAGDAVAA